MKLIISILVIIFTFIFFGCENKQQDKVQINTNESPRIYDHIKKARTIESSENPYEDGQKDAQIDIQIGQFYMKNER